MVCSRSASAEFLRGRGRRGSREESCQFSKSAERNVQSRLHGHYMSGRGTSNASPLRYQPKYAFGTVPLGPLVYGRIIVNKTAADDKVRSRTRHDVPACVEDFNGARITLNRVPLWPYEGIYRLVGKRRMNTAVAINSQRAFKTRVHALFLRHIDSDEPERGRRRRGCAGTDDRRQQQGQSKSDQS